MVTQAGALSAQRQDDAEQTARHDVLVSGDPPGASDRSDAAEDTEPRPAAAGLPAGTVLGGRYRLEELLAESNPTVTWRAFDQVLSRSVLVHLLPPGQDSAPDLLELARRASVATDARFLRVLDVVHGSATRSTSAADDPGTGDYIVCEYANGQSLEAILTHGPLSSLEAAWVVRELADALSGVHAAGLGHERINPDTVVITPTGNVRIVGLVIEKALRPRAGLPAGAAPLPDARTAELTDVRDLGRLLYACLVARWPGGPGFGLPAAPEAGHRWLTPRQVRAGVAPALDQVCDQILGDPPRHRGTPISTAVGVVNALTKVLGPADASSDLERRLRQPIPKVRSSVREDRTPVPPRPAGHAGAALAPPPAPGSATAAAPSGAEAVKTTLIRQPIPPAGAPPRRRPPRRRVGVVVVVVLLALVLAAAAMIALISRQSPDTAAGPGSTAPSPSSTPPAPVELTIAGVRDFDPQGDPPEENPGETKLAIDKDPSTRWKTNRYLGSPALGNLKRGVGLVVDLGSTQTVGSVRLELSGAGTDLDIRVPKGDAATATTPPMTSDSRWQVVGTATKATRTTTVDLTEPTQTRFLLVYLTSLPAENGGYRGGVYEIDVFS